MNSAMHRISGQCRASLQTGAKRNRQLTRVISTSATNLQDAPKPETGDNDPKESGKTASKDSGDTTPKELGKEISEEVVVEATIKESIQSTSNEDLVKKFNLKPNVEVGIRARFLENQRKQAEKEAAKRAAEAELKSGSEKINRLFEKLQLGGTRGSGSGGTAAAGPSVGKGVSESWKFLFDEDDLGDNRAKTSEDGADGENTEMLDRIPGISELFPSVAEYKQPTSTSSSTLMTPPTSVADRWKEPKTRDSERDAFKALFSSLFEQKKPDEQEATPGQKMQSLFSNFSRPNQGESADGDEQANSISLPLFGTHTTDSVPFLDTTPETPEDNDPMQVLRRQLENLSTRVEPIYLTRKPNTPSFEVMRNTVGPQDWITRDPTMPQDNSLFNAIREENKVAIRMRKELEEKSYDIVKVRDFVDELITPFLQPPASPSVDVVRPSSVSLDSLLSQAIMAASSTRLAAPNSASNSDEWENNFASTTDNASTRNQPRRSLHPFMGHAMVEHTRRQGLPVFIRTVRTESYKALIKSRWDAWHDGPGCLEILKEMQRSGALVDTETKSLVQVMRKELKAAAVTPSFTNADGTTSATQLQQYGWGDEEQAAPVVEMLNIIKTASEDGDNDYNMKRWAKRARYPTSPHSH
ncbi:hypothetical protein EDD21DRAFT_354554 [Dissophora ornata]|nr:hypothetical protein BGZ58_002356 [Dissophora ornata]KAI8600444.1 hypothetical protein EDD21DRAFT_354554 [Dissophora ornata]